MSKQVISIKLQELDKSIGQIHDCIENFNKNDKEKIQENIKLLKKQCELDEKLMSKRIEKTKFKSLFISEQELEQVAQQEYIIAVATNMYEYTYLFYDQAFDIEAGNSQFDETKALYKTVVDYDTKSISLYSLSDGQLKELKTIEMPF